MSEYLKKLTITTADGERKEMLVPYGPEIDARFGDVYHTLGDLNTTITEHSTRFPKIDGLSRNMFEIVMRLHGFNISSSWDTMDLEGGSGYIDDEGRILIAQNNKIIYSNFDCAISDVTLSELYNKDASKIAELAPGIFEIKTSDWHNLFGTMSSRSDRRISFSGHPTNLSNLTTLDYGSMNGIYGIVDMKNVDTSSATTMYHMFYYSRGLTSLDVSNFDTSKVTNMCYMFSGCSGLTSLDVSNFDTSEVTNMCSMFSGCSGLTSLDLSNFDTSKVTNMSFMFYWSSGLTSLDVSNFDTSKVTTMILMFYDCSRLTTLKFPNIGNNTTTSVITLDLSACPLNRESLKYCLIDNIFDRTTLTNPKTFNIQLSAASKALLTDEEIASITAKGFTII